MLLSAGMQRDHEVEFLLDRKLQHRETGLLSARTEADSSVADPVTFDKLGVDVGVVADNELEGEVVSD